MPARVPFAASSVSSDDAGDNLADQPILQDPQPASVREVQPHLLPPPAVRRTFMQYITCHAAKDVPPSNEIRTSKYTLLTFLPVNLFLQFTRVVNVYFLIISGVQFIPQLSPTSWFTTVMPLAFVLLINAIKEGYDDIRRNRSDSEVNDQKVLVLRDGELDEVDTNWGDLVVGDLVKLTDGQELPADLVFLSSSNSDNLCYVETANLDGETDFKVKHCYPRTAGKHRAHEFQDFCRRHVIRFEPPNPHLYTFDGAVVLSGPPYNEAGEEAEQGDDAVDVHVLVPLVRSQRQHTLSIDNLLIRGCKMRTTGWMIGVVVFTGEESKIFMNRVESPRKVTQLERHMNVLVLTMAGILFFFACMLSAGNQIWMNVEGGQWYLDMQDEYPDFGPGFPGWAIGVIRYIILLHGMIPISLYVTLEVVKVLQCVLVLNSDLAMYHSPSDIPFVCHSTNLNEDLGQVEYVLADKTGTLTQNVMGFVLLSVGGTLYGRSSLYGQSSGTSVGPEGGSTGQAVPVVVADMRPHPQHIPVTTPHTVTLDPELQLRLGGYFEDLATGGKSTTKNPRQRKESVDAEAQRFFNHLALCNTVVPGVHEDGGVVYQSSSPDEEALVQGAAYMGFKLISRSCSKVQVVYHGQTWEYEVLATLEFNPDRKRMSTVCRCPDGVVRVFCKGADTMVMARLAPDQQLVGNIRQHLEEAAVAGFRTLCFSQRELSGGPLQQCLDAYRAACVSVDDRERKLAAAAELIETDMELIGCTAVEDKLQDGVPEAIRSLIDAGIKVWVLTGDKVETAINIALSCQLLTSDMSLVEIRDRDFDGVGTDDVIDVEQVLEAKCEEVRMEFESLAAQMEAEGRVAEDGVSNVGLVVEGGALTALVCNNLTAKFIRLCSACKSVVFCRVSPMQKASMTKMVRAHLNAITLAIGDGDNDVPMLKAAHIGCAISGREGRAAVMAADYSFAQFRFVARLLLVHGRNSFKRNTEAVQYIFYKNWVENLTYVFYAFVTGFSSQPLYTTGFIATFNVFWTSYNIVAYSILEQDLSASTVMANPHLYSETLHTTRKTVLQNQLFYILLGTWHALVVYFVPMYASYQPDRNGVPDNIWEIGCTIYFAIIITVNLKLAMKTRYWTWINHSLLWLAIGTLFLFTYLYGLVWPAAPISGASNMSTMATRLFVSAQFWLAGVLLAPVLALLPDWILLAFQRTFYPTVANLYQESEQLQDLRASALRELAVRNSQASNPARAASSATELAPHTATALNRSA